MEQHPLPGVKRVLVCGAGGFIGSHLVTSLVQLGYHVTGADLKYPEFALTDAHVFNIIDLTNQHDVACLFDAVKPDHVYQLAADMGGAEYIFSGLNDANVFYNSGQINFNIVTNCVKFGVKRVFYSSSACIYPEGKQLTVDCEALRESDAYPANPDSDYGWEKLMSERLYQAFARNHGLEVRIARYHNIFGPNGTWRGGKEKAPAAFCRKIAQVKLGINPDVEVFGDGLQTRSFLFIDACIEATLDLMASGFDKPLNIGSSYGISINDLAKLAGWAGHLYEDREQGVPQSAQILQLRHVESNVQGVRGRSSNNELIKTVLSYSPGYSYRELQRGIQITYNWVLEQLRQAQPQPNGQGHGVGAQ